MKRLLLLVPAVVFGVAAQTVSLKEVDPVRMPSEVDSNSPAFWRDGRFYLVNSTGEGPKLSIGPTQFELSEPEAAPIEREIDWPVWMEAVWKDADGVVFGWYHQEHEYVCGEQRPTMPQIGAALSFDGGRSFRDLGVILASSAPIDCSSKNGYFAGGHGDFSVVPDRDGKFLYFLFSNYGGPVETQGVAIARMAVEDRFAPSGKVWKYFNNGWTEPGLGGQLSPIFPVVKSWQDADSDAFWGPSVHWNLFLQTYVILLNHACCEPGWPQEGVYVTFNADLDKPYAWTTPKKILDGVSWYPQVLGLGPGETDSIAGEKARLYVYGESFWEITFGKP